MKQMLGLSQLIASHHERLNIKSLAEMLMEDLQDCHCFIYGRDGDDPQLLADLPLLKGSLEYEMFDQRIDLILLGEILRNDCVPLTYRLQGRQVSISGRCSMLPQVCGVDWYLGKGYSGRVGGDVRLRFKVSVKDVLSLARDLS